MISTDFKNQNIDRLYSLDFLRGVSALFVLFYHMQNFSVIRGYGLPLHNELIFIYKFGWIFVDLFFLISGFIFFYKYYEVINKKRISLKNYLILRLTRLYPLIVVTLFTTAILQGLNFFFFGKFFIYHKNDFLSFLLNLVFLQTGFFNLGYSFNAPSWTLGVEFWLYLVFFFYASKFEKDILKVIVIVLISFSIFYLYFPSNGVLFYGSEFLRGIGSFYLGGLSFYLFKIISQKSLRVRKIFTTTSSLICLFAYVLTTLKLNNPENNFLQNIINDEFLLFSLLIHPLLCLTFLLSTKLSSFSLKKFPKILGELSFGIYMWHVPVQLLVIFLIKTNLIPDLIDTKIYQFTYILVVLLIAFLSLNKIEKPIQNFLRDIYLKK